MKIGRLIQRKLETKPNFVRNSEALGTISRERTV